MLSHVTIVIPVLDEQEVLDKLTEELAAVLENLDLQWNVLFVDDGSQDNTKIKLKQLHASDERFTGISLSRTFGKEAAIAAGLQYAEGDAVILMDGDLQHPPVAIPLFLDRWRAGFNVVYGIRERRSQGLLRELPRRLFYALFRQLAHTKLPTGIADFVLLDRQAVDAFNQIQEQTRFSKGLFGWIGFKSATVPFLCDERLGGISRWSFVKLARLALDGLVSFSSVPLKFWSYVGALVSLGALVYSVAFFVQTLVSDTDVPGFPSLIVSIMFFAGVQLVSLGIIGEYVARIYDEVKNRPLYIVAETIGVTTNRSLRGTGLRGDRHSVQRERSPKVSQHDFDS